MDRVETADDWLGNQAPAPRAVAALAAELEAAPVAASPAPAAPADDQAKAPDPAPKTSTPKAKSKPKAEGGGVLGRRGDRDSGEIWKGCPVRALGVNGEVSYYLDRHGQLRAVDNHTAQKILHLFGDRIESLCWNFPTFDKEGVRRPGRFDQTSASMAMITAASEKGLFNPDGAVRGVGAWKDDDGNLIYHCGQHLITAEGQKEPCDHQGKIYPAYPPIPAPALEAGRADPAPEVLKVLHSWNFQRPDVDPMLSLGMIAVMMICGALDWRPVFWLTGDAASGKSTFQDMIKFLLGEKGLIQSNDPTKSGVTSRLGHSSLPVGLDEVEPSTDDHSNKERDLITLARLAASGGQWLRGSADQKGASGNVYSAFLFSSILIPGTMGPQDRSRLITLSLGTLPTDAPKLVLDPRTWRSRGAVMKRLLIDRWPTWAERLQIWREALGAAGMIGRNLDNYATTLGLADMLLSAALPQPEAVKGWAEKITKATRAEVDEIGSDAEDMLRHLLGQPFDVYRRGEMWHVAHWIMAAAALPGAPRELVQLDSASVIDDQARREAAKRANEKLAKAGLRVKGEGEAAELFIANQPLPGLLRLFERSRWKHGEWSQSSGRVKGAKPVPQPLTLAGQRCRGVYIPLRNVAGMLAFPMDRTATHGEPAPPPMPADWEDFGE
jgi:hypothetical protein